MNEGTAYFKDTKFNLSDSRVFYCRLFHSEEPKSLDQQWESLTFHPTPSQQPSWITNSTSTTDQLSMKRNAHSGSLLSSKEQSLQGGSSYFENAVDSRRDSNDISLNNVPLPPSPDMFAQSKESDHLETFNLKRADSGPVEALRVARPHLASPNEFLSHSKGQDSGISSGKTAVLVCSDAYLNAGLQS